MYASGIVLFLFKDIPSKFVRWCIKHLTTTLQLTNGHKCFTYFVKMLENEGISNKSRTLKLLNGRSGYDDKIIKSIGFGTHIFKYKGVPLQITFSEAKKESAIIFSRDVPERLDISVTKLGRSHKLFDELQASIQNEIEKENSEHRLWYFDRGWSSERLYQDRSFDTIFVDESIKEEIKDFLTTFISKKDWYLKHGISYQTGILLYGEPGSGKTSIMRAIATYLNKELAVLSASSLRYIDQAMNTLPNNAIIIIEDIDSSSSVSPRKGGFKNGMAKSLDRFGGSDQDSSEGTVGPETDDASDLGGITLSWNKESIAEVLNAIDGLSSVEGRILICSTNHIENIDPAVIRPGRIDLSLYIGYTTKESFISFIKSFYPEEIDLIEKLQNNISTMKITPVVIAQLQNDYMLKMSAKNIVDRYITFV